MVISLFSSTHPSRQSGFIVPIFTSGDNMTQALSGWLLLLLQKKLISNEG
jgi:hypothetical protein